MTLKKGNKIRKNCKEECFLLLSMMNFDHSLDYYYYYYFNSSGTMVLWSNVYDLGCGIFNFHFSTKKKNLI